MCVCFFSKSSSVKWSTHQRDDMLSHILVKQKIVFILRLHLIPSLQSSVCTDRHFIRNHYKFCEWQKPFSTERLFLSGDDHPGDINPGHDTHDPRQKDRLVCTVNFYGKICLKYSLNITRCLVAFYVVTLGPVV